MPLMGISRILYQEGNGYIFILFYKAYMQTKRFALKDVF